MTVNLSTRSARMPGIPEPPVRCTGSPRACRHAAHGRTAQQATRAPGSAAEHRRQQTPRSCRAKLDPVPTGDRARPGDGADGGVVQVVIADVREFGRDVGSCAVRVYLSYRLMAGFEVDNSLAFSTALLVGGARVFSPSTNWMHRSRAHALRVLRQVSS